MVSRRIGFSDFPEAWDGPFELEFRFVSKHPHVVRFRAELRSHGFDLYVPRFMLPGEGSDQIPPAIIAQLSTTCPLGPIGFDREASTHAGRDLCVYEYAEEKGHSHRFDLMAGGRRYSLYVPKEVFGTRAPPPRIALEFGLPS
jgi:hypothetical protein